MEQNSTKIRKGISLVFIVGMIVTVIVFLRSILSGPLSGHPYVDSYIYSLLVPINFFTVAFLIWPIHFTKKLKLIFTIIFLLISILPFIIIIGSISQNNLAIIEMNRYEYAMFIFRFYSFKIVIPFVAFIRMLFVKPVELN